MEGKDALKEGLYFIHGYYPQGMENPNFNSNEINRNQVILMKDSLEDIYDIEAYYVNGAEILGENRIEQGNYAYYDGQRLRAAQDNPSVMMYNELSRQLSRSISYNNYGSQPIETSWRISSVFSYHVNVGHGNCSIIVFCEGNSWHMWMVDCSVYDFMNKHNYSANLDKCLGDIKKECGIDKISKLLITHLHYDHINGIEHLIEKKYINQKTEVWMNVQYPWKQKTYIRILSQLKALGVTFIDPVMSNSTKNINIMYPAISFNEKNKAPDSNINNASVLYQICMNGQRMLFTGDMETEGWDGMRTCMPDLNDTTYYCISHHGSITGHLRNGCSSGLRRGRVYSLAECAGKSKRAILMGRDGAFNGIYSRKVLSDFHNIIKTEDAKAYVRIEWRNGKMKLV